MFPEWLFFVISTGGLFPTDSHEYDVFRFALSQHNDVPKLVPQVDMVDTGSSFAMTYACKFYINVYLIGVLLFPKPNLCSAHATCFLQPCCFSEFSTLHRWFVPVKYCRLSQVGEPQTFWCCERVSSYTVLKTSWITVRNNVRWNCKAGKMS